MDKLHCLGGVKFLTTYVKSLYNDGSTINSVHIAGSDAKPEVSLNETQSIMLDNNGDYRYYGANPNNYVRFNNELWRIIGVFHNVENGAETKETRIKIIRADSIGNYSYDSSDSTVNSGYGVNDWSKSDLMNELNTLYYNSQSGTCYNGESNASTTCNFTSTGLNSTARGMVSNAVYYLGGSPVYDGLYANDYYAFERGTSVYNCSTDDGSCPRATSWTGIVGVMYPSDYAYAVDLSLCTKNGFNYYVDTNCTETDWLLDKISSKQWTISPYISSACAASTNSNGEVYYGTYTHQANLILPVLYLNSNVTITAGSGTTSDPYQLS